MNDKKGQTDYKQQKYDLNLGNTKKTDNFIFNATKNNEVTFAVASGDQRHLDCFRKRQADQRGQPEIIGYASVIDKERFTCSEGQDLEHDMADRSETTSKSDISET